jgi:hypothetical protein
LFLPLPDEANDVCIMVDGQMPMVNLADFTLDRWQPSEQLQSGGTGPFRANERCLWQSKKSQNKK